jgi:hypothetical protein
MPADPHLKEYCTSNGDGTSEPGQTPVLFQRMLLHSALYIYSTAHDILAGHGSIVRQHHNMITSWPPPLPNHYYRLMLGVGPGLPLAEPTAKAVVHTYNLSHYWLDHLQISWTTTALFWSCRGNC